MERLITVTATGTAAATGTGTGTGTATGTGTDGAAEGLSAGSRADAVRKRRPGENHSTPVEPSARIDPMFRYAFVLAASAVADAPKAAVPVLTAAVDGARS
ncbi:hypothetical protein [Streptomyces sp. NPDC059894]|uniref:hypothetical protein n=1 Tax=unclassified Streptomyces TaxID=2593676 RepID=UPI003666B614